MTYRIDQYNGDGVEGAPEQEREFGSDSAARAWLGSYVARVAETYEIENGPLYGYGDAPDGDEDRPSETWVAGYATGPDGWIQVFRLD